MKISWTTVPTGNKPARSPGNLSPIPQAAVLLSTLLAVLALEFAAVPAFSQDTVNFTMATSGVMSPRAYMPETNYAFWPKFGNTPGQNPPGTQTYSVALVSGNGFVAQLWAAPGADQPESALPAASSTTTFRTGAAAGLVNVILGTLTNVPADCPVATVQVRVWQWSYYEQWIFSWEQARNYNGDVLGKSAPFNVEAIGGGTHRQFCSICGI